MKQDKITELYNGCSALITEKTQEIHQLVLGDGDYDADIMFIGDMPSTEEEAARTPFVGKSARVLNRCLEIMDLKREQVYVTHLIKYHPYKVNERTGRIVARTPKKDEISFFLSYLIEEINIISPKIIVTLGSLPLKTVMEDNSLQIKSEHGKVRKKIINNHSYTVLPISQPALANHYDDDTSDEDMEVLKELVKYVAFEPDKSTFETTEKYNIEPKKNNMSSEQIVKQEVLKNNEGKLKVIVIYGGDGYADDPTLVALDRIGNVLNELNTRIIRFDLYKEGYSIKSFFNELLDSHGVVIATTVEWIGIGGHLQLFLDKCWKYGSKKIFNGIYLFGVVISKQGYERDTYNHLIKSWELLGGLQGSDICACIKKSIDLETNQALLNAIDKKTEEFYRIAHQGRVILPTSIRENKIYIEIPIEKYIAQEGETQREQEVNETIIPNYETFIEKQQKDIEDIAQILKKKLTSQTEHNQKTEPQIFNESFLGSNEPFECKIQWVINDNVGKNFIMDIRTKEINTSIGNVDACTIIINLDEVVLYKIIEGKMTIQRAFLTGEIKAKGDFTVLYKLDALFDFKNK